MRRKSLRNFAVNTKEQCVALINNLSISTRILCFLPKDDKNDMNIEVATEILNLLINIAENLFRGANKKEYIET
jgi:hypothetical protein